MARKRYYFKEKNHVGLSTIFVPGTKKSISIGAAQDDYRTSDPKEQTLIENHPFFKGRLVIKEVKDDVPVGKKAKPVDGDLHPTFEAKEFPDVTDINGAKDVLRGEPYKTHQARLNSPGNILKVAAEVGVSFPNWE